MDEAQTLRQARQYLLDLPRQLEQRLDGIATQLNAAAVARGNHTDSILSRNDAILEKVGDLGMDVEGWARQMLGRIDTLADAQAAHLSLLTHDPRVANPRRLGTIAALDIVVPDRGYLSNLAPRLIAFYRDHGVLLRPLGNTVYVMPPYCITADDLAQVWGAIGASLDTI